MGLLGDYLQNQKPVKQTGEGPYLRQRFPKLYGALGGLLGTAPDEFDGSVLDPLTAEVRKGAEMGYLPGLIAGSAPPMKGAAGLAGLAGMFVGKGSKTWDAVQATRAMELEKAGVDARKIWSETGTWKAPDGAWRQEIPDNAANVIGFGKNKESKMFEALDHQGLYDAYPAQQYTNAKITSESTLPPHLQKAVANERSGSYLHEGLDGEPLIQANAYTPENVKSTLTHEIQHAIQQKEGWAKGGNVDDAPIMVAQAKRDELSPLYYAKSATDAISNKAGELSSATYIKKLQDLSVKPNLKPSSITNMSPWYEYSSDIRSKFGPMPKQAGSARDNWLNDAAGFMYQKERQKVEMPEYKINHYLEQDLPALKRQYSKADRERNKYLPDTRKYYETEQKFNNLAKMSDFDQYQRLAGEAEARATQARIPLDAAQRRALFPADSYDVPMDQLIIRGLLK